MQDNFSTIIDKLSNEIQTLNDKDKEELTNKLETIYHDVLCKPKINMDGHDFVYTWYSTNSKTYTSLEEKNIIVVWSGGLDSTALLYGLAHRFPNKTITALSIYSNAGSRNSDKISREKLKERFDKEGLNIKYVTVDFNVYTAGMNGGLGQPVLWLTALASGVIGDNNALCFGYISSDCIWHYIEDFKGAFKNLNNITGNMDNELYFPLEWCSKYSIIEYMKQHNLFDLCNYCEDADIYNNGETCGKCKDCKEVEYYNLKQQTINKNKRVKTLDVQEEITKQGKIVKHLLTSSDKRIRTFIKRYNNTHKQKVTLKNLEKLEIKGIGLTSKLLIASKPYLLEV